MFEITDDTGTVYNGSEYEMLELWEQITTGVYIDKDLEELEWTGDIRLIEIKGTHA